MAGGAWLRRRTVSAQRIGQGRWLPIAAVALCILRPAAARAAALSVNSTADAVDVLPGDGICATATGTCTLRAAIQEANAVAGPDSISVPAGTYPLTVRGGSEDAAATGDLDILDDAVISGATTAPTVLSGNGVDRFFDVLAAAGATIMNVTIQSGNAVGPAASGGGIRNSGTLTLAGVAMRGNTAQNADGGGLANLGGGSAQLTNVTLSGNVAADRGGGIKNEPGGTVTLTNVTLTGNSATQGGAIDNFGTALVSNTILANSPSGGNCTGALITSLGHNLESADNCFLTTPGDLNNTNPLLGGLLLDSGGFTFTHALQAGSPAIDAGDNAICPPTDQRGAPRPTDGNNDGAFGCDIGAYEAPGPVPFTPTPSPTASVTDTPTPTETPAPPTSTETPLPPTVTPGGASIELSTATGSPGDQVAFAATLNAQGATVGSTNNDVTFASLETPVRALPGGEPDCTLNPELNKQPLFVFRPNRCAGTDCTMVRTAVFGLSFPVSPIPDRATLYTCTIRISPDAELGEYPLVISRVVLSNPEGTPVPGAIGVDGKVVVVARSTPTPTATVTATASHAATVSATPTFTPVQCAGDCDGRAEVTVDEIITLINIAVGNALLTACAAGDADRNGEISVDEIIAAVGNALNGCPAGGALRS